MTIKKGFDSNLHISKQASYRNCKHKVIEDGKNGQKTKHTLIQFENIYIKEKKIYE